MSSVPPSQTSRVPLGRLVGARSGDKGGNANVGLWIPVAVPDRDGAFSWLVDYMTVEQVHRLLPESAGLRVEIFELANLHAINIVIHGLLGRGVSENSSLDPQAKGLGELMRARIVDIPSRLLPAPDVSLA